MSTHGHVTFYELDKAKRTRPIQCYTWHDGHRSEAINDLLSLPFHIFDKQKAASVLWSQNNNDGIAEGYWAYNQHFCFAMQFVIDAGAAVRREQWTRDKVYQMWTAFIPLQTCPIAYATWFCQKRFNRWSVVPNASWCSYPGPDFVVLCTECRLNSYTIVFEAEEDYIQEIEEELTEEIAKKNALIPQPTITWKDERRDTDEYSVQCHITVAKKNNEFRIHVPFDAIYCELFWKDVDHANQLIAAGNVSQDLEAFLERWKR